MKKFTLLKPHFLFLIFLSILLSSCYRNIFLPSMAYAPQFRYKNETEIAVDANPRSGVQAQAAWAMTDHVGIQIQANAVSKTSGDILGGPNLYFSKQLDERSAFLFGISAGYSGGTYGQQIVRSTGSGATAFTAQPGYIFYDMSARWHGGYFQLSYGGRISERFSFYGGLRSQWLNCSRFSYTSQFYALDSTSHFIPGQVWTIDSRHGFTTIVDNFVGFRLGWKHFQFFFQAQWRAQYNGFNLNDTWVKFKGTTGTGGVIFLFGGRDGGS